MRPLPFSLVLLLGCPSPPDSGDDTGGGGGDTEPDTEPEPDTDTAIDTGGDTETDTAPNAPPSTPSVVVRPAAPVTGDALVADLTVGSVDPEGLPVTYRWAWKADGVPVTDVPDAGVPAGRAKRGETWTVEVVASDGAMESGVASASIAIGNAGPSAPGLALGPAIPGVDPLVCALDPEPADPEGDALDTTFAWTLGGAPYDVTADTYLAGDTIPASALCWGQTWTCQATVDDGELSAGASATVTLDAWPSSGVLWVYSSGTLGAIDTTALAAGFASAGADRFDVATELPPDLSPYRLIFFVVHQTALTPGEVAALDAWTAGGGGLVLLADHTVFNTVTVPTYNALLDSLGRTARFALGAHDGACTTPTRVAGALPGLDFRYVGSSAVDAGTSGTLVFEGASGQGLLAVEDRVLLLADTNALTGACGPLAPAAYDALMGCW